jgi:hypothetical protein
MLLLLMAYGWAIGESIEYRPLGDIDDFDFEWKLREEWPEVLDILREKEARGEPVTLGLYWQGTEIHGTFTVDPYPALPQYVKLWASWNQDRQLLPGCSWFTDYSWYLSRVLPPLLNAGVVIDAVECRDIY